MGNLGEILKLFSSQELLDGPLGEVLGEASICLWAWNISTDEMTWPNRSVVPTSSQLYKHDSTLETFLLSVVPSERSAVSSAFMNSAKQNQNLSVNYKYILPDGSKGTALIGGSPILNTKNKVEALIGIVQDKTESTKTSNRLSAAFGIRDKIARALESSIKPPILPTPPGFEVAASYRSGEGESTGDFYDLFPLGAHDWGLTIGDVGGHGIEAAAITTSVRFSLRSAALISKSPTKVIGAANEAHFAATIDGRFTTAHYIRIVCGNEGVKLRVATAGHPPLLIRRKNGTIKQLTGTGPMLGLMQQPEYAQAQTNLEIGDLLIGFTDGLSESRNNRGMFGDLELEQFIRDWENPIEHFPQTIHEQAVEFSDGIIQDDMATIILKRIE